MPGSRGRKHSSHPLLEIEIKFGKGKVDMVKVFRGDDPNELAEVGNHIPCCLYTHSTLIEMFLLLIQEFVARHGLKPSSIPIIAEHIEVTLDEARKNRKKERSRSKSRSLSRSISRSSSIGKCNCSVY